MKLKYVVFCIVVVLSMLLFVVASGCASSTALKGSISLNGSLNVEPLSNELSAAFIQTNQGVKITYRGTSTSEGIQAVDSGSVDIGGASRVLKVGEPHLLCHLIARDGIAIIVNPANPVRSLTLSQIRNILAGKIVNWSAVGGPDLTIQVVTREPDTSTRSVVEELIMAGTPISPRAAIILNNPDQKAAVMNDPQAIGYNPFAAALDGSVKALTVEGVEATRENAKESVYPLVRPLYFLTGTEPSTIVKAYIDYCLSPAGQKLVSDLGYVPVH